MPRKPQTEFPGGRSKIIAALGDSITWNYIYGTLACDFYVEQLAELLRAEGCDVKARNYGNSGERSSQMLRRIRCMTKSYDPAHLIERPELAIIFAGANDPGGGVTATTLTRVGTTATFTASADHNLGTGDVVSITGSDISAYNVPNAVITKVDATIFTYVMASDPGASSAGTPRFDHQTQANIEAMIIALKNGVTGTVGTQTALPSGYPPGTRFLVRYDTSTTGGIAGADPATLTGTLTGPRLWVARNSASGVAGWSRIEPDGDGIERIIVMSMHWLHFVSGGGDRVATPNATYAAVRVLQQAAVTAQAALSTGVTFFDLYAYQKALIVAGYEGELSGTWAAAPNDQHPSPHAGYTFAKGLLGHIQAQEGWIEALT